MIRHEETQTLQPKEIIAHGIKLVYRPMTINEERGRLVNTLDKIQWYVDNKYNINPPNNIKMLLPEIEEFQVFHTFNTKTDHEEVRRAIEVAKTKIDEAVSLLTDSEETKKLILSLEKEINTVKSAFGVFKIMVPEGFLLKTKYTLKFTNFGMKGSYFPEEALIISRVQGEIEGRTTASSLIHEITHIGVQHIVDELELNQLEKEVFVDCLVAHSNLINHFPHYLKQAKKPQNLVKYASVLELDEKLEIALTQEGKELSNAVKVLKEWKRVN